MTSEKILELNELNFESIVLEAPGLVLVDFTAAWCGPCKPMFHVVDRVAQELPHVTVGSVDVDACPELASRYGVRGMPTLIAFDRGREIARRLGLTSEQGVLELLGEKSRGDFGSNRGRSSTA